jgi:hypothetical protein
VGGSVAAGFLAFVGAAALLRLRELALIRRFVTGRLGAR